MLEVKKRDGESGASLVARFTKRVKQSGIMKEVRSRRFRARATNRNKRRLSALKRETKRKEVEDLRKLGKM